jgi:PAS domain S-box-containing protein
MSNVFMESVDPILIETVDGEIDRVNNEAEEMYGWKKENLQGKPGDKIIHPDYKDKMAKYRQRAIDGEKVKHMEMVRIHKNGESIRTHTNIFSLTDNVGNIEGIAMIDRKREE